MSAIVGTGTAEAQWQGWPALHRFPALHLEGCRRVVLVAPHPDDEILGAGGLLAILAARGAEVHLLAVTDGEASHPGSPSTAPAELATRRRAESMRALARLGLRGVTVTRLGLPDGRVAEAERELTDALQAELAMAGASTVCLSTWDGDGHPDHEAVGRVARSVCSFLDVRLLQYAIWMWHWAGPDDPRVPWSRARSLQLDPAVHAAKLAALGSFESQLYPLSADPADAAILGAATLARLTRAGEVFFV